MKGAETIRMTRPPELSDYSIKDDHSSSSSSEGFSEPQTLEKSSIHGMHGFGTMLGFGKSKSSSSINEHKGWNLFRRERTPTPANEPPDDRIDNTEQRADFTEREVSWWKRTIHRSRPSTVPSNNLNLYDESISPEEKMVLSTTDKLEAKIQDSFDNLVDDSASPTKLKQSDSDSDEYDQDSLIEASRIIKSKLEAMDSDSPETPPNEPIMKVHFKPSNADTSIYDYVYESPNAKNSKNIDLMMVDTSSVTFGKCQRIVTCLSGELERLRNDKSIVGICDYLLTLSKKCENDLKNFESLKGIKPEPCSHNEEMSQLQEEVKESNLKYRNTSEALRATEDENKKLRDKLKEVIEFNNMCKQFFEEYKDQLSLLYKQVNKEVTKNESLKETKEKITRDYETEKNRNMELAENLEMSQEILKDMEARYLEAINKFTSPTTTKDVTCLEAEKSDLKETIQKLTKGNNRLVNDCQRERKKVLDLRKQNQITRKYVDSILTFQNSCVQFITQFLVSFKGVIDPNDIMHLEQQLFHVSSFNPLAHGNIDYRSEKKIISELEVFESDSYELFQHLINNILVQIFKKYTVEQKSNSFLTSQLCALRKESQDKDDYIQRILRDTNNLKLKLRKA